MTADRIVDEARRQLEEGGLASLSMRALAKTLGTTPMALYRHVGDEEQLLDLVLDAYSRHLGDLELSEDPAAKLREIFLAIFDTLIAESWIVELLQRGGRGGAGALVLVDAAIAAGQELGMSGRRAILCYRALWNYTLGSLLNADPGDRAAGLLAKIHEAGPERLPALHAVTGDRPLAATTRETYLDGLDVLIDGYVARFA